MPLKVSQVTSVGWTVLPRLQNGTTCPFSLEELEQAIADRTVVELLLKIDDPDGFIETAIRLGRDEINTAMTDAGEALSGRWSRKTGVEDDVNCCVMAMVLEAVQLNFRD